MRPLILLAALSAFPSVALATSGGPDGYGYYFLDNTATDAPAYDATWLDTAASMGTIIGDSSSGASDGDDAATSVSLPFDVTFYGTSYSSVSVCSNGYLSFVSTACAYNNYALSSASDLGDKVAVFWDDLNPASSYGATGEVYGYEAGVAPHRTYTVVWSDVDHYGTYPSSGYTGATFGVVLHEGSDELTLLYDDVTFGYASYDSGLSATIGIDYGDNSGAYATYYSQYSYSSASLAAGLAVGFQTSPVFVAVTDGSGNEGTTVDFVAGAADVGGGTIVSYDYDCDGDGSFEGSSSDGTFSCTYDDDGELAVYVEATSTTGDTHGAYGSAAIANVAPEPTAATLNADYYDSTVTDNGVGYDYVLYGYEGAWVLQNCAATDVASDTVTITHDFGDGTTVDAASDETVTYTYGDDGAFLVECEAHDEDGGSSGPFWAAYAYSITLSLENVAPTIDSVSTPGGAEGSAASFTASASDPGTDDVLTYTWAFGDGASGTGASTTHTYADDGTYTWTLTVDDGDGGVTSTSGSAPVTNVDPTITSTPGASVSEGATYTYTPSVTDPGAEVYSWSLTTGPSGASIASATGVVTWPTSASDAGTAPTFTIVVSDGDGGSATQTWTVTVTEVDSDGDGMSDRYETEHGFDPYDASDASADADGDGVSNYDESVDGSDPTAFDGPTAPVAASPVGGEVVGTAPDLVVDDATSPRGWELTYAYEVYADEAMSTLVASMDGVAEGTGQTTWMVDVALTEDTPYWWRARADDGLVTGDWSDVEWFLASDADGAPGVPTPTSPIDYATVTTLTPNLVFTTALDPEGTAVTYDVQVWDASGSTVVAQATGITDDTADAYAEWAVTPALTEDQSYAWEVRAVDAGGGASAWSDAAWFFVSTEDGAPTDVSWLDPVEGDELLFVAPELDWSDATDPEGGAIRYAVEADTVASFDSADHQQWATETSWLDLGVEGASLPENEDAYLRVRAEDEGGIPGAWATIHVFVRGDNDAPGVPELLSPVDGESAASTPTLTWGEAADPEHDTVTYEVLVGDASDLADATWSATVAGTGTGQVSDTVDTELGEGTWYWSVRAIDELGARSDWAAAQSFVVDAQGDSGGDSGDSAGDSGDSGGDSGDSGDSGGDSGDSGGDDKGTGCGCSTGGSSGAPAAAGLLLALAATRRRRQA